MSTLNGDLDMTRTKATIDAVREYVDKRLAQGGSALPAGANIHTTEVVFPAKALAEILAEQLSKSLAEAFAKTMAQIKWPKPTAQMRLDNNEVAKALKEFGELVATSPIPMVEAVDLTPLYELAEEIRRSNDAMLELMNQLSQMLAKALKQDAKSPTTVVIEHSDGTQSTIRRN